MSENLDSMIASMTEMQNLMTRISGSMDSTVASATGMAESGQRSVEDMNAMKVTLDQMRDRVADFDDAVRPLRNYFYWEPHCLNITVCEGIRAAFDATELYLAVQDNMATLQTDMTAMIGGMDEMVGGMAEMNAASSDGGAVPLLIETATVMRQTSETIDSTFGGLIEQMQQMTDTATAMGEAFDASKSDDYFYLPPEVFDNADFQKGLKLFPSPDGKAARLIITHDVNPASEEGISAVDDQLTAAHEAEGHLAGGSRHLLGRHRGHLSRHPIRRQVRHHDRRPSPP